MVAPLNRLLRVQKSESQAVWTLFTVMFSHQLVFVIFLSVVTGAYLDNFAASTLPWVYIVLGGVNWVIMQVIVRTGERFSIVKTLVPMEIIAFGVILVIAFLFTISTNRWIYAGAFLLVEIWFFLPRVTFLPFMQSIFDLQQVKRLSGIINSGQSSGGVITGLIMPLLVGAFGSKWLLYIAAITLILQVPLCLILYRISKRQSNKADRKKTGESDYKEKVTLKMLWSSKFLRLISFSMICYIFIVYFIQFNFLAALKTQYSAEQIASFMGGFFGVVNGIQWAMESLLAGRLMRRFGVIKVHLIKPLLIMIMALVGLIASFFFLPAVFIFSIILRGMDRSLNSFYFASTNVMYQPLPSNLRGSVQSYIVGVLSAMSSVVAQVILLAVTLFPPEMTFGLVSTVVFITSAVWFVGGRIVKQEYVHALKDAFRIHSPYNERDYDIDDPKVFQTLIDTLESKQEEQILFSLRLLADQKLDAHYEGTFQWALMQLIQHPSEQVRHEVLEICANRDIENRASIAERLWKKVQNEESEAVVARIILTYSAMQGEKAIPRLMPFLSHTSKEIRVQTTIAMWKYCGVYGIFASAETLKGFIEAPTIDDKIYLTGILAQIAIPSFYEPILPLLHSENQLLKNAALRACYHLPHSNLLGPVIGSLRNLRSKPHAIKTLGAFGDMAVDALELTLNSQAKGHLQWQLAIYKSLNEIGTPKALQVLYYHFETESDWRLLFVISKGLIHGEWTFDHSVSKQRIFHLVKETCSYYHYNIFRIQISKDFDIIGKIEGALLSLNSKLRWFLFNLLHLYHPSKTILSLESVFQGNNKPAQAKGIELIDSVYPKAIKQSIMPLLEARMDAKPDQLGQVLPSIPKGVNFKKISVGECLKELLAPNFEADSWPKVVTLHALNITLPLWKVKTGKAFLQDNDLSVESFVERIETLLEEDSDDLVRETAFGALIKIQRERKTELAMRFKNDRNRAIRNYANAIIERKPMSLTLERMLSLKGSDLFKSADEETLSFLIQMGEEVEYPEGSPIFKTGEPGGALFVILHGTVRIHQGETQISTLDKGKCLGELTIIDGKTHVVDASAEDDVVLLKIDRDDLFYILNDSIQVTQSLFNILAERLRGLVEGNLLDTEEHQKKALHLLA